MNRLLVCFAALGYLTIGASGAPTFTDQEVAAGYLNPGDSAIVVQETEIQGDGSAETFLYAVTIRNDGTASAGQLTKLELRDGGNTLVSITDLSGINTGGITVALNYTVPAGATRTLKALVWVAGATAVSGGETLKLALNYYYTLNGTAGSSGWILDHFAEEFVKSGFEKVEESLLDPVYLNPGNTGTVQVITWEDHDANASPIYVSSITIKNLESATQDDVSAIIINLNANGTDLAPITLTDLSAWNGDGVEYVFPAPLMLNDERRLTCEVQVTISTTPTATRKIRTKVTLELLENGQPFEQMSASPATHTILMSGVEVVEDVSRLPEPLVVNAGGTLNQRVRLKDDDVNGLGVAIDRVRVWNSDDATASGEELLEIAVYDSRGLLGRVRDAVSLAAFQGLGVEIPFSRPIVLGDDGQTTITITYTVGDPVPGHTLKPKAQVWCDEARARGWSPVATYPDAVALYPGGLENVEELPLTPTTVFSSQRVCVLKVKLVDTDQGDADVLINPVVISNLGTAEPGDVVGLEVTDGEGTVLGQARSLSGFRDSGVTITLARSTQVPDDGTLELWVWIIAADPPRDITGKDVRLRLTVIQSEAGKGYQATVESANAWPLELNNPPVVDFDWAPQEPMWDEEVTFTPDASDPDGDALVRFEWDFDGDGTVDEITESAQAVTYTYEDYPEGGRFEVTLTVTDARGLTASKTKPITVQPRPNQPPTADFEWAPAEPEAGDVVTFTATATDPDDPPDTPFTYAWDFGDGASLPASEDNQEVTHIYAAAGTYTVTLTVTDARGAETEVQKEITVAEAVNDPPQVTALDIDPASPQVNQEITFTTTTTDPEGDEITDWEWDFDGDGTPDATTNANTATHTYTAPGFYTVRVRAKDGGGSNTFGPWYELEFYVRRAGNVIDAILTQNPVAAEAVIEFFAPEGATDLRLRVFDLLGRPVFESTTPTGDRFRWDLTDSGGDPVPNGLYFYLITAVLDGRTIRSEVGRILVLR